MLVNVPRIDLKDEPSPFQNREARLQKQYNWNSLRFWGNAYSDWLYQTMADFDDLILPGLYFESPKGTKCDLSFDDDGALLINGIKYTAPTYQGNEAIKGNKTYEGQTKLSGGLQLLSPNGTVFNVTVDDDGKLTTEKEAKNDSTNG